MRHAYILDLDGTVFDLSHRLHYIDHSNPEGNDWVAFHAAVKDDKPITEVIDVVRAVSNFYGRDIIVMTGRSIGSMDDTAHALQQVGIHPTATYMRGIKDRRPDYVLKKEYLDDLYKNYPNITIHGVFEDRKQVSQMWRDQGLRVFQVAEGDY